MNIRNKKAVGSILLAIGLAMCVIQLSYFWDLHKIVASQLYVWEGRILIVLSGAFILRGLYLLFQPVASYTIHVSPSFLVFAGYDHDHASRGWDSFVSSHVTLQAARDSIPELLKRPNTSFDWLYVVDLHSEKIVLEMDMESGALNPTRH